MATQRRYWFSLRRKTWWRKRAPSLRQTPSLQQDAEAGRDAFIAGRDITVIQAPLRDGDLAGTGDLPKPDADAVRADLDRLLAAAPETASTIEACAFLSSSPVPLGWLSGIGQSALDQIADGDLASSDGQALVMAPEVSGIVRTAIAPERVPGLLEQAGRFLAHCPWPPRCLSAMASGAGPSCGTSQLPFPVILMQRGVRASVAGTHTSGTAIFIGDTPAAASSAMACCQEPWPSVRTGQCGHSPRGRPRHPLSAGGRDEGTGQHSGAPR